MRINPLRGIWLLAVVLLSAGRCAAAEATQEAPGLPVGQRAPRFALKDQTGQEVSLEALLRKGPVAVVFYRSADWCLYCKLHLIQLQRILREVESSGGRVVAISYDSPETLKRFASAKKIRFPLLSDVGSKTIDAYRMNTEEATAQFAGVSRHGTFILDQQGIIRAKFPVFSYEDRPTVDALVKALKAAQNRSEGTKS